MSKKFDSLNFEMLNTSAGSQNDRRNTVFYSSSKRGGKPLSRITLFHSGANRIQRMPETPPPLNELKRHKNDIWSFSYPSRSRYYSRLNSMDFTGFQVFILTMTISSKLYDFLCRDAFRLLTKKFYRYLLKNGYDYVYKLEFTLGCSLMNQGFYFKENKKECYYECSNCRFAKYLKPMPHFHIVIYSKNKVYFSRNYKHSDKAREFSAIWTSLLFGFSGLGIAFCCDFDYQAVYKDMLNTSCFLEVPKDLKEKIFYLSYYFTKEKEYQNIIPEKFQGLKMWGYGQENYGNITKNPVYIEISQNMYDEIYKHAQSLALHKKRKTCDQATLYQNCTDCFRYSFCRMYKKNGVYHKDINEILNAFVKNDRFNRLNYTDTSYIHLFEQIKKCDSLYSYRDCNNCSYADSLCNLIF